MKFKLFPVILTAALTSVITLFVAAHYQNKIQFFAAASQHSLPVNYAGYTEGNGAIRSVPPVDFQPAAEAAVKAVVHIKTSTKGRTVTTQPQMDDFFGQLFGQRQYYIPPQMGSGSGVVISPDGYIVTNNHVVADASEVTVSFNDRYSTKAKVVATDPSTDIAVIKVDDKNLPYMEFGNSDDVHLGQWVLAVGYPLTLDATVTAGIVSAKSRAIGINRTQSASAIESFIQTDAAVNPGNSGGALVNTAGQLIGINSAIASPTGSYAGYSYAIPSNIVRKAVNDLMKYGAVQRGYLGIDLINSRNATPEQLANLGIDGKEDGVYVAGVHTGSGAAKAGLQKGDYIVKVNSETIHSEPELQEQVARYHPGDNLSITYVRSGKQYTASVELKNLNGSTDIVKENNNVVKLMGASFRSLSDQEKTKLGVEGGVMVTDMGTGTLSRQTQMGKGFVVTNINDMPIASVNDLQQAAGQGDKLQFGGFYPGKQGMYYYGITNSNNDLE
jgi:Do/DeqQ family serine protease